MEQGPHWQPTTRQKLVGLAVVVVFLFITYAYSAQWTGFSDKTLWDWLQLLVIPLVIGVGGLLFNSRRERERELQEAAQRKLELEVEDQRAQDEALQAYIEGMERLLIEQKLRDSPEGTEAPRAVGRARTLTVLPMLDDSRKASVLQFLYEAGLLGDKERPAVIKLDDAGLSGAVLSGLNLMGADLSGANLAQADLSGANLAQADLSRTKLIQADLINANLIEADLIEADLIEAELTWIDLSGADLGKANLREAVGITNEELEQQTHLLEDATMPNGQKYEKWLEDKEGRGEDGG